MGGRVPPAVAAAFLAACRAELDAPKPGNVHRWAAGHGMTCADFEASALAAAPHVAAAGRPVGARILAAVTATRAAVGQNTNLGIVLLCAPLAAAAEAVADGERLGPAVARVLAGLGPADAADLFQAIRTAAPGGLGAAAAHDVHGPPPASPLLAMAAAAGRDRIAWNWVHALADPLAVGAPALAGYRARGWPAALALAAVHLGFMARHPDSHVARRHGIEVARALAAEVAPLAAALAAAADPAALLPDLLALDARLKAARVNPGTSADLTVASAFAAALGGS